METDGPAVTSAEDGDGHPLTRRVLRTAIELDLITPADVAENRAIVRSLSQSHAVAVIQCGDRSWIGKQMNGPATADGDWRAELAVYRAAPAVEDRSVVPDFVGHSKAQKVMLTEVLGPSWLWLDEAEMQSPWSVEIFARIATSLALWHQASQSLTNIDTAIPWLLLAIKDDPGDRYREPVGLDELVASVLGDHILRSSLDEIARCWTRSHVMHGDIRLANVAFQPGGTIRLLDWKAGGWGDPRWDLAGLLQELYSAGIQEGLDTSAHRAAVLSAYAERATSPSALTEDDSTLQAFVAGRLILQALRLQNWPEGTDELVAAHLEAARAIRPT